MSWKQPKKVIKNTLFVLSLLSFFGSIVWLSIYYIWNNRPDLVHKYDNNMPNVYANKIDRLMTRTHKGKSPDDTFKRYQQLAEALKGTTTLHKYYDVFRENQIKMIDYLVQAQRPDEAKKLAKNWQKDYPYDFDAKFKYAEVLEGIDIKLALDYYQEIYKKHNDIFELNQRYVALLLKNGQFNQALKIAEYSKTQNRKQTDVKFHFYYADELNPKFGEKSKIFAPAIKTSNHGYQVKLTLQPQKLKKLRFDFDRLLIGSTITALSFDIKTPRKEFANIPYKPLRHLTVSNDTLTVAGKDPYVQVLLPDELTGSSQALQITANIGIVKNKPLVLDTITQHQDWRINCSSNLEFEKNQEQTFVLVQHGKKYLSNPITNHENCQYIKIQFPLQQNFTFSQLKIKTANQEWLDENLVELNGIEKNNQGFFVVLKSNPFVVLKTNLTSAVNGFDIEMRLGNKP